MFSPTLYWKSHWIWYFNRFFLPFIYLFIYSFACIYRSRNLSDELNAEPFKTFRSSYGFQLNNYKEGYEQWLLTFTKRGEGGGGEYSRIEFRIIWLNITFFAADLFMIFDEILIFEYILFYVGFRENFPFVFFRDNFFGAFSIFIDCVLLSTNSIFCCCLIRIYSR